MPLTLNLSGIVNGQTIDPEDVTVPFNQVKSFVDGLETDLATANTNRINGDNGIINGTSPLNKLALGTTTTLTIASDAITVTRTRHLIDTEASAPADDLVTINGGTPGDVLVLQSVSAARVVTIKHNTGNVFNFAGADVVLDNPRKAWIGVWDGTRWCQLAAASPTLQVRELIDTTPLSTPTLSLPDRTIINTGYGAPRLELAPTLAARNRFSVRAAAATVVAEGIAAPTLTGTPVEANAPDSTYVSFSSGAAPGFGAGFNSATFNLVQRRHNPTFSCVLRTPTDISNLRIWVGLVSAVPTNVDDLAAGTQGIAFRFSSVAGDTGWRGICDDGTTMAATANFSPSVAADTRYLLRIRVDGSAGGTAYFSVDNGPELSLNSSMPVAGQNLGFTMMVFTNIASARQMIVSRMLVEYD